MKIILILSVIIIFAACANKGLIKKSENKQSLTKAEQILEKALKAHGGTLFNKAHYQFVFREKKYTFKNEGPDYTYEVQSTKGDVTLKYIMNSHSIQSYENGISVSLSEKDQTRYRNSLNSVIYFATLPHKLTDEAVNLQYVGSTQIKSKPYNILKVYFDEEGGGVDHDDIFYYWINATNNQIDFLAYSYSVNGGGVRFRSAENKRTVEGIIFQDYINYKAEVGTPLNDLPRLWEADMLKKLSEIRTENVIGLKK